MTAASPSQFNVMQSPRNGCLFALIIVPMYFGIGGPIIFISEIYLGIVGFFGAFLVVAYLLKLFISRHLQAQTIVTTGSDGLTIEVTRKGLRIPTGSSFFRWEQLRGFNYQTSRRKPFLLVLHWVGGGKIVFQDEETALLYQFLKQTYPQKEMDYWLWPPSE